MALHSINLCDGYGGFELALKPFGIRTVARVERDAYAAAVLVERMAQARLDHCPIWDEVGSFDGNPWRGNVDIITAGFPCPDFSTAGKRRGVNGTQWLWPDLSRIIGEVKPEWVILENVPGFVRLGGLARVLSDLAVLGFDAEWGLLSASAAGASHKRKRFWLVAHSNGDRRTTERFPLVYSETRDADACRSTSTQWPPLRHEASEWDGWILAGGPQPFLCRSSDGPPCGLADALHLGGNGLVPQAAREAIVQLARRFTFQPKEV